MLSLLTPTRNRPNELHRMIASARDTASGFLNIVCYVDEDDPSYELEGGARIIRGPRITLSDMWNKCAEASSGSILMMANDDVVFRTAGWDAIIKEAFRSCPDRILMVHGSPGPGENFTSHPVIHRKWVETVGYFTWPHFSGDYADTFIHWIARELGREKSLPYELEHMHPAFSKAPDDQTYRDRSIAHAKEDPNALWEQSLPDRLRAVQALRAVMR